MSEVCRKLTNKEIAVIIVTENVETTVDVEALEEAIVQALEIKDMDIRHLTKLLDDKSKLLESICRKYDL